MTGFKPQKTLAFAALVSLALSQITGVQLGDYDGLFAMCPGVLWAGEECQSLEWKSGVCYVVPSNLGGQVQSASPHQGNQGACKLFHETNCLGEGTPMITYPGIENFETSGLYSPFESWMCRKIPW